MSVYQCWCILWHLNRGDVEMAQFCAMLPRSFFSSGDEIMRASFLAGVADAMRGPDDR